MKPGVIEVNGKHFEPFIDEQSIADAVKRISEDINQHYEGKNPLFIGVLNGVFMFASDLMKNISIPCEISFIKVSSYTGTSSSGSVKQLIGLHQSVENREIIILEDIVDTGKTMKVLLDLLWAENPKSIAIATLLHKPEASIENIALDYVGLVIENKFVVGYGLDFDGFGRNLKELYKLV